MNWLGLNLGFGCTDCSELMNDARDSAYAVDFNGTQAAIRTGYSVNTANVIASQNLTKLNVHNKIKKLVTEKSIRTEVTADKVLQNIAEIAFAEKDVADRDRLKTLEILGKHLVLFEKPDGKFTESIEQSTSVEVTSEVPGHIRQIFDMMKPVERQRLRRSLEKKLISGEVVDVEELMCPTDDGHFISKKASGIFKFLCVHATIHKDILSINVGTGIRSQKYYNPFDVIIISHTPYRYFFRVIFNKSFRLISENTAWANGIDTYLFICKDPA